MRKVINGSTISYQNVAGDVVFNSENELNEAVLSGAVPLGPWIPRVTIQILELPE
jgi:hypothetical protein